jgi:hypothetical protein
MNRRRHFDNWFRGWIPKELLLFLQAATERGLEIKDAQNIHPAKLAHMIFCQSIPELKA